MRCQQRIVHLFQQAPSQPCSTFIVMMMMMVVMMVVMVVVVVVMVVGTGMLMIKWDAK